MIDHILSLIAPHRCLGCDQEGALLCSACAKVLPKIPPRCYRCRKISLDYKTCAGCRRTSKLHSLRAVTYHDGLAKEVVWKLKFENARAAANDIAKMMAISSTPSEEAIITHVPTATSRVRRRGYDQARLIARALAKRNSMMHTTLLRRRGQHQQVGASRRERQMQLEGAYQVVDANLASGAHIILVDDVLTTGATLEAVTAALKAAGARRVDALVFTQA